MFLGYQILRCIEIVLKYLDGYQNKECLAPKLYLNSMQNKLIVCTTGFTYQQQEKYGEVLTKLGCNYVSQMKQQTNLMLVNCTATEKYKVSVLQRKIANERVNKVNCVTIKWLVDCQKKNKIVPFDNYFIPSIFYGVTVGILGFSISECLEIQKLIKSNGGKTVRVDDQINPHQSNLSCVLTTDQAFEKQQFNDSMNQLVFVGLQWLQKSLKRKICKFPKNYALNYQLLKKDEKKEIKDKKRLENKYQQIRNCSLLRIQEDFLKDVIIYIDESVDRQYAKLLEKITCAWGGLYLTKLNSLVTHILVDSLKQNKQNHYLKYGDLVEIIRVNWLVDSVHIMCRMQEEDYRVRQCLKQKSEGQNLRSCMSLSSLIKRHDRVSISGKIEQKKIVTINRKYKSVLFKNLNFIIECSQSKQKELIGLGTKIRENGGILWDGVSKSMKQIYLILKDSGENKQILEKYKKYEEFIVTVSYRWINYCIANGQIFPHDKENYFIFKPFCIKTPNPQFLTFRIEVLCDDDVFKRRIREVLSILGCPAKVNLKELTHCICVGQYQKVSKYQVLRSNTNIHFVKFQWITTSITQGKVVQIQHFLIP